MAVNGAAGPQTVDAAEVLNAAPVGAALSWTILVCGVAALIDGFDVQALAFVAPVLIEEWGTPAAGFGVIFSAGLLGIMIGQFLFSPLADRFGRKKLIIAGMLLFALLSLATAFAKDMPTLLVLRFIGGIGLGGVTPNLIALTAEYSPKRLRATMIATMFAGYSLGAVAGGMLSSVLVPAFGWQSMFIVGAVAPLLMIPLLLFGLPESVRYLIIAGADQTRIGAVLDKFWPARPRAASEVFVLNEARLAGFSVRRLFDREFAATTLLLWLIYLVAMLLTYILLSWVPTILRGEGLPIAQAQRAGAVLSLGGVIGGVVFSMAADRFGALRVLVITYLLSGAAIFAMGQAGVDGGLVLITAFVAGFCALGAQTTLNATVANLYPTQIRATGLGYAMGIGRIGSVVGPIVGGMLIAAQWPSSSLFAVSAAPTLVAAALLVVLAFVRARTLQTAGA